MKKTTKNRLFKSISAFLFACFICFAFYAGSQANVVEWGAVAGGGKSTGGTNTLRGTISQLAAGKSTNVDVLRHGYRIAIPQRPAVDCSAPASCAVSTCYGPSDGALTFRNIKCATPPCSFPRGATQYYQYLWQTSSTYTHAAMQNGSDWGDTAARCPGGACTKTGTTMSITPTTGTSWYLIVRSYNGGQNGGSPGNDGLLGSGLDPLGDVTLGPYEYDDTAPTVVINDPAASSWQTANFTFDVTNADTGCAGLGASSCEYRVVSNSVQTLGWTPYTCSTDPSITVGAAANCRDQGVNMCEVFVQTTDAKGNGPDSKSRQFSIDWTPPTVTINNPAASSWQAADFTFDVTNADTGGSGLSTCYYRVLSNSVQTLGWTSYTCASDPSITVGAAANCRDQGADMCQVEAYNTDVATNTGTTQTRQFSIDWTA
ncbi:MAG: hypothetical protein ABIH66_12040, partial [bacterium]